MGSLHTQAVAFIKTWEMDGLMENSLWVEKYRPKDLSTYIGNEHLKDKVLYSYNEKSYPWYPSKHDKWCHQLSDPVDIVVDLSANVSLLYLPNPNFAKKYAKRTLKNHVEFSAMEDFEIVDASYMIFSEQLMLKQMLVKENIPHKTLVSNVYDNSKFMFSDVVNMYGIWNREEISLYYI